MRRLLLCLSLGLTLAFTLGTAAQDQAPAGEPAYSVQLRFKIDAGRAQRYRLFQTFTKRLAAAGFQKNPGQEGEDHYAAEMTGTLPAKALPALLADSFVQTAVLTPKGFAPADEQQSVLTRFYLTTALGINRQKDVTEQARTALAPLGFQESVAADTHGGSQLLGWLPFGRLKQLLTDKQDVLVKPATEPGLTVVKVPLIKAAVVIPEPDNLKGAQEASPAPALTDKNLERVSADLRAALASAGEKKLRVEVVLRSVPAPSDPLLDFQAAGLALDGRFGPVLYGQATAGSITLLAAMPEVSSIRLPQAARGYGAFEVDFVPLNRPASSANRPKQIKAVVIASDFTGYQALVGKGLPKNTRLIDFTRELSPDFTPAERGAGDGAASEGTRLAERFVSEHHVDELVLARIDSAAPYQVEAVAATIDGRAWTSPAFLARIAELQQAQRRVEEERSELRVVRRIALDNFGIDPTARANRDKYRQRQKDFDSLEKEVNAKSQRLLDFRAQARELEGASLVLVALTWTDGYADLHGVLPTLRFMDRGALQSAAWWQAVPVRGPGVWEGHFREADGVLQFAAGGIRPDLNFMGWRTKAGETNSLLPAGAVVQLKLQWQEAHDPRYTSSAEDAYRLPIAPLKLLVLRQRDPSGKGVPADLFDVVARSAGWPERLENDARHAVYQTEVKFQVAQPGRYLVVIEGKQPVSLAPAGSATLLNQKSEIRPRLTVEAIDPAHRAAGQVVFETVGAGK